MTTKQTQTPCDRAHRITFGIELECLLPIGRLRAGGYHRGIEIGQGFPRGWNAQRDGSLRTRRRGYQGIEIVSPILQGLDGLEQVRWVAGLLKEMGGRVNPTCGMHIHIGAISAAGSRMDEVADWVRRLINLTAQHELAFYGATGTRRRYDGRYCRSLKRGIWAGKKEKLAKKLTEDELRLEAAGLSRYQMLNIMPLFTRKRTVEFRAFAGTLNPLKMIASIQMCLAAATRALDVNTSFDTPRARYAGGGAAGAMKRFFYLMGWTLGRKDYGKPDCTAAGWMQATDKMKPAKRELMRLARKFDAAGTAL